MYMPTYITAVVGHGVAAPAYASVLISICTAVTALQVNPQKPQTLIPKP